VFRQRFNANPATGEIPIAALAQVLRAVIPQLKLTIVPIEDLPGLAGSPGVKQSDSIVDGMATNISAKI